MVRAHKAETKVGREAPQPVNSRKHTERDGGRRVTGKGWAGRSVQMGRVAPSTWMSYTGLEEGRAAKAL